MSSDATSPTSTPSRSARRGQRPTALPPHQRARRPDTTRALEMLAELSDPLTRARAATALLAALDADRLEVAEVRRAAVAEAEVSTRRLARELGLSVGAASDLQRAAHGRTRRTSRD